MHVRLTCVALLSLSACITNQEPGPAPELQPAALAEYDAQARFEQRMSDDAVVELVVRLSRSDGACTLLPAHMTATLDGVAGEISFGGYYVGDGEWPHNEDGCVDPSIRFPAGTTADRGMLMLSDGETTWTIEIEAPFVARTFAFALPGGFPLHSNDEVTLAVTPGTDELSQVHVELRSPSRVEAFYDGYRLEPVAPDRVRITLPALTATESATIDAYGMSQLRFSRCDVPGGCRGGARVGSSLPVELAP